VPLDAGTGMPEEPCSRWRRKAPAVAPLRAPVARIDPVTVLVPVAALGPVQQQGEQAIVEVAEGRFGDDRPVLLGPAPNHLVQLGNEHRLREGSAGDHDGA
jgi:hypothetical protein